MTTACMYSIIQRLKTLTSMNILSWVYITAHNFSCMYDVWSAVFVHLPYKAYYSLLSLRNSRVLRGCMQLPLQEGAMKATGVKSEK